jgi:hypothetical protein
MPPTLLSEVCAETIRPERPLPALVLRRRFITSVAAVAEDGAGLGVGAYEIARTAGILRRISSDRDVNWTARRIVVQYTAGFATIPPDLKQAAELFVRIITSQFGRDPLMRRERVDGVGEFDYWVGSTAGDNNSPVPPDVAALLAPYMSGDI